jgi:YgiT-type zinc finger domain-containing protein
MKEKKWIDCPSCGSKGSMKTKKNLCETYSIKGYAPITIDHLDGQFCTVCGEGFYSIASEKLIKATVADEKAKQDSGRTVASELIEVDTMAHLLSISRQRVHQMMDEGKIQYVYVGKLRFPVKNAASRIKVMHRKDKKKTVKNFSHQMHQ